MPVDETRNECLESCAFICRGAEKDPERFGTEESNLVEELFGGHVGEEDIDEAEVWRAGLQKIQRSPGGMGDRCL
jgi:hypothetical protein